MQELTKQQIKKAESKVLTLVDTADGFIVEDEIGADLASKFLRNIKDTENKIEAKRLEFTAPLNQSLKAINATFKNLKAPLAEAKKTVSDKILSWRRIEEEKVRIAEEKAMKEELEKIRKIQETCESELTVEDKQKTINEIVNTEPPREEIRRPEKTIGNAQVKKLWTFEVTDFSKVPDKYKEINRVEVNADIRAGERDIPGIKIYQKPILSVV